MRKSLGGWAMRRTVWILLALLAAAGAWGWVRGRPAAGEGDYLFLSVSEVNNRAVHGAPLSLEGAEGDAFDEATRSVRVTRRGALPGGRTRALVFHRADALDTILESRVFAVERLPARVPVERALRRPGFQAGPEGEPVRADNVVDNATRLVPGPLFVDAIAPDGTASLRWGGASVALPAGKGWAMALARGASGVVERLEDGPSWDGWVGERLDRGDALTVVRVHNHGFWPRSRVRLTGANRTRE